MEINAVAFDAKRAFNNFTGLGNYSRLVLELLYLTKPEWKYLLYTPKLPKIPPVIPLLENPANKVVTPPGPMARLTGSFWRTWGVTSRLRNDGASLYHGLSNELPLNIHKAGVPSVVTIHDLIFRRFPQYYKPVDRKIYDYKFRRAAELATRVIAISEQTRHDIMQFYNIPPEKIDVVYQGCDAQFQRPVAPEQIREVKRKYGLSHPYIIGVGTIEERKNQMLTAQALPQLPGDIHLVLVGRNARGYADKIMRYAAQNGLSERIHILSGIPFSDFPPLYAGAILSSYPSRFEGFGIPVIESISAGTPVIVGKGSCLEEAAGEHAPAVDCDDVDEFASRALEIIESDDLRTFLVEEGRKHIARFSHRNCAEGIIQTYHKAIDQYAG
ncbi:MAG: glycosyltransferase family 4 protein [Muribaculaceae bacterium]|nr:glycosyltransferase family 4 protein [Muribaculaceae bacterium]